MKNRRLLWFIIILTLVSLYVSLPGVIPVKFSFRNFSIDKEIKRPALNWEAGSFSLKRDLEIKRDMESQKHSSEREIRWAKASLKEVDAQEKKVVDDIKKKDKLKG